MGTDINIMLQKKEKGKWVDKGELELGRNYQLFSVLAGVRGSSKPIAYPRGLPDDFVVETEIEGKGYERENMHNGFWMGEHSFSYLGLDEILKYNWAKTQFDNDSWLFIPDELRDAVFYSRNPKNWRICFGFDS